MQKQVMIKAVELAKRFEGDWVARMKMALKMAWALIKKSAQRPIEMIKNELEKDFSKPAVGVSLAHLTLNIWEKYGKSRIYVNASNVNGYFDFDQDGNIQKWYFDCGYDYQVKEELNATAELMKNGHLNFL